MNDLQYQMDELESISKQFSHEEKEVRGKHDVIKADRATIKERSSELLLIKAAYKKVGAVIGMLF